MKSSPAVNNTASITVTVAPQALVARIAGGAYRQVGRGADLGLDGSGSADPDEDPAAMSYAWACVDAATDADTCGLSLASDAAVAVAANLMAAGTYRFSLVVAKAGRTSAAATAVIEVLAGSPPAVSIASLTSAKYNADAGYVSLAATVEAAGSGLGVATMWEAVDSDVAAPFQFMGANAATVANRLATVVRVSSLTAGATYTFQLTATAGGPGGESSFAQVTLTMNEAPSSGFLEVQPVAGHTPGTSFTFSAVSWVDEDLPLLYRFGTLPVNPADGSLDTSRLSPFGGEQSDATDSGVILSQGANATNYTVRCSEFWLGGGSRAVIL